MLVSNVARNMHTNNCLEFTWAFLQKMHHLQHFPCQMNVLHIFVNGLKISPGVKFPMLYRKSMTFKETLSSIAVANEACKEGPTINIA